MINFNRVYFSVDVVAEENVELYISCCGIFPHFPQYFHNVNLRCNIYNIGLSFLLSDV